MTIESAARELRQLAAQVTEDTEAEGTARLLELVAVRDNAEELRSALVIVGARELLLAVEETP